MFEELAIMNGSRLMLLGGISYTLWSLHGLLWRGWSVGETFFWFWWELILAGLSTTVLMYRWHRKVLGQADAPSFRQALAVFGGLAITLALATLFTGLALGAEGITLVQGTLGPFWRARQPMMLTLAALALLVHLMTAHGRRFAHTTKAQIESLLMNRFWPVLGVYMVLICDHHWNDRDEIDTSQGHQLLMGGSLLGIKLWLELRQFFAVGKALPAAAEPVQNATR